MTAVERLKEFYMSPTGRDPLNLLLAFEKAMEWEKEQIKRAFIDGEENVWDRNKNEHNFEFDTHNDYYNKTFKKY
jgi:hypothetical protein